MVDGDHGAGAGVDVDLRAANLTDVGARQVTRQPTAALVAPTNASASSCTHSYALVMMGGIPLTRRQWARTATATPAVTRQDAHVQ